MNEKLLEKIIAFGRECEWIEFKCNNSNPQEIGEYISAMANSAALHGQEKGYIVWGVEDNKLEVVGTDFDPYKRKIGSQPLINWLTTQLHPHNDFSTNKFNYEGLSIVIFEVDSAKLRPVEFKNVAYVRVDSCKQPLSKFDELQRKLWLLDPNKDWSVEVCKGATVEDLDPLAIEKARYEYKEKNPKFNNEVDGWDDLVFLNKAKFCIRGQITRTAIVLLGKAESESFISPAVAGMSWILKDRDGVEIDYEHFHPPFILNVDNVFAKIRNLKYRYMQEGTLFPKEVDQYDPWVIREALHNCIAHQDYTKSGRINIVEMPDKLIFTNLGDFIPGSVEEVIRRDSPEHVYRNRFLADAMVNCQMIDTIGSGIRKMFIAQKKRYFPLPEYKIDSGVNAKVTLQIDGKVLDLSYAKVLLSNPEIDIETTMLLDKVQRKEKLSKDEIKYLKNKNLVEGRSPNIHISASIAEVTDQKADYIKNKGLNDGFYKEQILEHIKQFGGSSKIEIDKLVIGQLSDVMSQEQKAKKVENLLQSLKRKGVICNSKRKWFIA